MELVPLKVKILKDSNGCKYPPFNELPPKLREEMTWTKLIDKYGGWHYDKLCGHGEVDSFNPDVDSWIGVCLVPTAFGEMAAVTWPEQCEILAEADFATFHDERAHVHEAPETVNADVLNALRAKYGLGAGKIDPTVLDAEDQKLLDPEHPAPGIVKNFRKKYADFKARRGFTIKE